MKENKTKERNYTVYMHTSPSGKRYIGITRQNPPKKRWKNGNAYKGSKHFYNAIQKYGFENFSHEILFTELTKEEAEQKETELITHYKSNQSDFGYNIANGGNCVGSVSEETKKKLRDAHIGKKLSFEHIEKIKENSKKQFTNELRDMLAEINSIEVSQYYRDGTFIRNWKSAAEAERKTGISSISSCCTGNRKTAGNYIWQHSNVVLTKEYIAWCNDNRNYGRMVSVCQYDMDGILLKVYEGQIEAELQTGINRTSINNCCRKVSRTAGHYIWRYANDLLTEEDIKWCNETISEKCEKAVIQYSLSGEFIRVFKSITSVYNELGFDKSMIVKCCKGKCEKAYGFIWRYASNIQDYHSTPSPTLSQVI